MSNARIYSNCPGPKVHSASNNFKSPDISDPVPVRGGGGGGGGGGTGLALIGALEYPVRTLYCVSFKCASYFYVRKGVSSS